MMMKMNNFIVSYLKLLLVTFVALYLIISPIAQSSYQKGYERGVSEKCENVLEYISDNFQMPIYYISSNQSARNQS